MKIFNYKLGNTLDLLIIALIIVTTYFTHNRLLEVQTTIKQSAFEKYEVSDIHQFEKMLACIGSSLGSEEYAAYLVQPKTYKKLYKEKIAASHNLFALPNKFNLRDDQNLELDLLKNGFANATLQNPYLLKSYIDENKSCLVLPIYNYRTVVAEVYIFIPKDKIWSEKQVKSNIASVQILGKLIK